MIRKELTREDMSEENWNRREQAKDDFLRCTSTGKHVWENGTWIVDDGEEESVRRCKRCGLVKPKKFIQRMKSKLHKWLPCSISFRSPSSSRESLRGK